MRAFVTGSRAYGTPRESSDTDLVVLVSEEDLGILIGQSLDQPGGSGQDMRCVSLRFGRLNLVCTTDPADYELWATGTVQMKDRRPVARDRAVRIFDALRYAQYVQEVARHDEGDEIRERAKMGVQVSLLRLVAIPGSKPVWPKEFADMVAKLEENPNDKAQWGVIADWLDENEERELAEAFRWVFKREGVELKRGDSKGVGLYWWLDKVPSAVAIHYSNYGFDTHTLPGMAAALANALKKAREEIQ